MIPRIRFRFHLILVALAAALAMPAIMSAAPPPGIPDGWSDGFVYSNGIRIHYYHAIPEPGKPVIVMVHGVTDNGLCWTTLTEDIQKSYDIYMLDSRGHGLSDPFTDADSADTLTKDVVGFVNAMKFEKPILLGHSMGAATVMRIGAEYPDLPRAVIMLDPLIGGRSGPARGGPAQAAAPGAARPRPQAAPGALVMFGSPEALVAQNDEPFGDLVATCRRQNPKWDPVDCQYWALSKKQYHGPYSAAQMQAMTGTMGIGDALAKITAPALILKADAPPDVRKATEKIVSGLKNVKMVYIDGAAHNLHHDQRKRTVEVLTEFLDTLNSR